MNDKVNIVHIIDTTGPGGAETMFIELIKCMDRNKYNPIVIITGKGWLYEKLMQMDIKPLIIDSKGSFNLSYFLKIILVIYKFRIKLVHSHLLGTNVYTSIISAITRVPVISTFHGMVDIADERLISIKLNLIRLFSKKVIFVSDTLRDEMSKYCNFKSKAYVIYNSIITTVDCSNVSEDVSNNTVNILSIGNIRPAKGYDYLIEAASIFKENNIDIKFTILGDDDNELGKALKIKCKDLGVSDIVIFKGFVDNVTDYLRTADLFLLSSVSEGFSISTIESMANCVPVIATRCGGPEEIINSYVDGILVSPRSARAIFNAINEIMDNDKLRQRIIDNAIEKINNKYTVDNLKLEYSNLYDSIVKI